MPLVTSITIHSNGNSPDVKMIGGMMVDVQNGFVPMTSTPIKELTTANPLKYTNTTMNSTKLSINERYRRLIPYMTFYYANNEFNTPPPENYENQNVEVEKLELIESQIHGNGNQRQPKKIYYNSHRNIPRYQGNRISQFNIASANPTKVYKDFLSSKENFKPSPTYNHLVADQGPTYNYNYDPRPLQKHVIKAPSTPFSPQRKPYFELYHDNDVNTRSYFPEKEAVQQFKLVPYDQTPPFKITTPVKAPVQKEIIYSIPKKQIAVPVFIPKYNFYEKQRPFRPQQYLYDINTNTPLLSRKPPMTVSESYYENHQPPTEFRPVIENGFKPIISSTTEVPVYTSIDDELPLDNFDEPQKSTVETVVNVEQPAKSFTPSYYKHVTEQPMYKLPSSNVFSLGDLLDSLQQKKTIPKPITKDNVGASIRTLLQVLTALKAEPENLETELPLLSSPKPFLLPEIIKNHKESVESERPPIDIEPEFHEEPYLAPINHPSQHLDDYPSGGGTSQRFPPAVHSDNEGGTPGKPGRDYPIMTTIPKTKFNCKTQRYKGFFADPETRCQVWHYCDLNGGQASFLCPNGTIFSQAGLTCDWWFNVRCDSTTQLYVLNESLYKYILPHSPKFPEDYSGPLVDKYLTLKFKEMEEQFKKNKNKQSATDKVSSEDEETKEEQSQESSTDTTESSQETARTEVNNVSEASVIIGSPGLSGNVERLHD